MLLFSLLKARQTAGQPSDPDAVHACCLQATLSPRLIRGLCCQSPYPHPRPDWTPQELLTPRPVMNIHPSASFPASPSDCPSFSAAS